LTGDVAGYISAGDTFTGGQAGTGAERKQRREQDDGLVFQTELQRFQGKNPSDIIRTGAILSKIAATF
jgi:hypothetical protein